MVCVKQSYVRRLCFSDILWLQAGTVQTENISGGTLFLSKLLFK